MNTTTTRSAGNARSGHKATHRRSAHEKQGGRGRFPWEDEARQELAKLVAEAATTITRACALQSVDEDASYIQEIRALNLAFRVGMSTEAGGPMPEPFEGSRTLTFGWERGAEVAADIAELDAAGLVY